jgi:hypothetical protein
LNFAGSAFSEKRMKLSIETAGQVSAAACPERVDTVDKVCDELGVTAG